MVKIIVENDKLYLEQAGRKLQLNSATIYHKPEGYEIVAFIIKGRGHDRKTFRQKKFVKPTNIEYKIQNHRNSPSYLWSPHETWKEYHYAQGKGWYINYYEEF